MFDSSTVKKLRIKKEQWDRLLADHQSQQPVYKPKAYTASEYIPAPLYTPLDLADYSYDDKLNFPGMYPFTRGIYPSMYRQSIWSARQTLGLGSATRQNEVFQAFIRFGVNAIPIGFDLPTQVGFDSDHPMAYGEIGRVGIALDSLEDMEALFHDIAIDKINTTMNVSAPACVIMAMYLAHAEKQGIAWDTLQGTIQNDILKEYIAQGSYIFPPHPSLRLASDLIAFCAENVPKWNPISVCGYHIREAGATAVQELAFTIANGIAYVDAAVRAGHRVDDFAPGFSFFFSAHSNLFEEIAKFRAARRLWARTMKERFGAENPESQKLRMHVETSGATLTERFVDVNTIRIAFQALAAVLGGTQSLQTSHRDNTTPHPNIQADLIARYTQDLIANEIGVTDTIDPLGGSYYIEALTDKLEKEAEELIQKLDLLGGSVKGIETGFMQGEIERSAYQYQKELDSGERLIIGRNKYEDDQEIPWHQPKADPLTAERQIIGLRKMKQARDHQAVVIALRELRSTAQSTQNIMPSIIKAVKAYATIGEICNILREVFGVYRSTDLI